jgi:dihydrofolate reductase
MAKLRVCNFSVSLDGFGAGVDQSLEAPLGIGAERLHEWIFQTRSGLRMLGQEGGTTGVDDAYFKAGDEGIGATIMGRNMFGPIRGDWPNLEWTGWWGPNPPYHHPVFVLTHHPRPPLEMEGGTTFYFVEEPIQDVLARAFDAAGGQDVRLGGGVSTVQQFMRARLLDELHVALLPVLLGQGERLFERIQDVANDYVAERVECTEHVVHVRLNRRT